MGDIVGAYKSLCIHYGLKWVKTENRLLGKLWQRNYWEHIVRNESELNRIREYICNNPAQWEVDKLNPGRSAMQELSPVARTDERSHGENEP